MPNFSKLNSLFEEYIELRSDHEGNLARQSFKLKKIAGFFITSIFASIIGLSVAFKGLLAAFSGSRDIISIILIICGILLFIIGLILSIVLRRKGNKQRKLLTDDNSKIKDLLEEARSILDSI